MRMVARRLRVPCIVYISPDFPDSLTMIHFLAYYHTYHRAVQAVLAFRVATSYPKIANDSQHFNPNALDL